MSLYQDFLNHNLCVIPLHQGRPVVEWSQYYYDLPTPEEVAKWRGDEYALVCGGVSNVIAVDIDTDDTARIEGFCGYTPVRKRGSKGFTAFFRHNGEPSRIWKHNGQVICELLSDKRLTTIPPSPHRKTGEPYIWLDAHGLGDIELPSLPADFIQIMDALYPAPKRTYVPSNINYTTHDKVGLSEAADMLDFISSDCPRDEWLTVGMALRDEFGDAACDMWHRWSAKGGKRYNHNDAQSAWRSFTGDGVTIGSLVYRAKQNGWIYQTKIETGFEVDLSYVYKKNTVEPLKVHGLVGEIADWITASAISPQPILSLAAAISFVGLIKGHRIKNRVQGARTNILALSLSPTGGGKDWPQKAIDNLAVACGLEQSLMSRPTSGTALLKGLQNANGCGLLSIEEMGRYMGNITNKNAQPFQGEITDYIIEIFSSANKIFRGKQFADEKANPRIIIHNPHLCCIASTVPERLKAACSTSQVIDGFLNRWLVFVAPVRPKKRFEVRMMQPPKELVDKITYWLAENPIAKDAYGNLGEMEEIGFSQEAWDIFLKFEEEMATLLETEPYPINELYVRSAEHVIKLSTVICDDKQIGIHDIQAAIAIVKQSNQQIAMFASGIVDNQHEADVVFVLDLIRKNPHITRNQLTHKTRRLSQKLRNEILSQLCEAGDVVVEHQGNKASFHVPHTVKA